LKGAGCSIFLFHLNLFNQNCKAGDFDFTFLSCLPVLISWLIVGINYIIIIIKDFTKICAYDTICKWKWKSSKKA